MKRPGFGGRPQRGQNAIFAAHVDYNYDVRYANSHYRGPGTFLGVAKLEPKDAIEVVLNDQKGLYSVTWVREMGQDADWGTIFASQAGDGDGILTLITCTGDFNPETQEYDRRTVVRARLFE